MKPFTAEQQSAFHSWMAEARQQGRVDALATSIHGLAVAYFRLADATDGNSELLIDIIMSALSQVEAEQAAQSEQD